ncbi:MAG: hypothetical protein AAGA90_23885 [Actinomycetota bacterium]
MGWLTNLLPSLPSLWPPRLYVDDRAGGKVDPWRKEPASRTITRDGAEYVLDVCPDCELGSGQRYYDDIAGETHTGYLTCETCMGTGMVEDWSGEPSPVLRSHWLLGEHYESPYGGMGEPKLAALRKQNGAALRRYER